MESKFRIQTVIFFKLFSEEKLSFTQRSPFFPSPLLLLLCQKGFEEACLPHQPRRIRNCCSCWSLGLCLLSVLKQCPETSVEAEAALCRRCTCTQTDGWSLLQRDWRLQISSVSFDWTLLVGSPARVRDPFQVFHAVSDTYDWQMIFLSSNPVLCQRRQEIGDTTVCEERESTPHC